jgi:23S rRNA pseudouridine2604 synthase
MHIEKGNVFVNKKRASVGDMVKPSDRVLVNGHIIEAQTPDDLIIIALNKPIGITSTTETGAENNIIDFVNHSHRIFPIGRLDKDSQGLIFLTNNGDLVNKILRAGNRHEKEYLVTVNKHITQDFIEGMANGVPLLGTKTKKCKVQMESPFIFRITLIQGLNRQIRRMCSHFGYDVVKLERVRIMNITLKGLPLGDWRNFTEEEVKELFKLIERSSSTPRKERSFSKNKEFRKASLTDNRDRENKPKPKSARFIKKKTDAQTEEGSIKSNNPTKNKKGKSELRSFKGNNSTREETTPKKWNSEAKTKSKATQKSSKVTRSTKNKPAAKTSLNPKSFKSYRQKSAKR